MKESKNNLKKRGKTGGNTTFFELIGWLYRRNKLRRRYRCDTYRAHQRKQLTTASCFLLLLTVLLSFSMMYVQFYDPTVTARYELGVSCTDGIAANPMLEVGSVTCAVTVQIGATTPFVWETPAMTVSDMLTDVGYEMGELDEINVPPESVVEEGMTVKITQVTYEDVEEIVSVPYETEYIDIRTIPRGTTARVSYGTEGVAKQFLRNRYENGVYVSSEVLSEEIVTEPLNEVLNRGVGGVVSGVDGSFRYSYYLDVTATAYGGYTETRYTYSGTVAKEGVIAVDPNVIPLGTKVYVKGDYGDYGFCSADDIGSGIKGYHIDIFMDATYQEMMQFGRQSMRVYILE